jgi:hypothetical protein
MPALRKKSLGRCLTALVLFCVYFSSLQLSHGAVLRSPDEVFCPLRKTWVKKTAAIPAAIAGKQKEPLKDICARIERKESFLFELTESLRFIRATPNDRETEKLFFSYFAKGKPALKFYISSQNIPEPQFLGSIKAEKRANNSQTELSASPKNPAPAKYQLSLIAGAADEFFPAVAVELKNISRRISPRAPPASV